ATWVGSIFHACLINPAWLRWCAAHTPWYQRPPLAPPPTWPGPGASPTPPGYGAYAAPPAPTVPGPVPTTPATPVSTGPTFPGVVSGPRVVRGPRVVSGPAARPVDTPAPPPVTAGTVDVNAATYEQLVALPGFTPERARQVLAERDRRRGFGSVQEFAT